MKNAVEVALCQVNPAWLDPDTNRNRMRSWVTRACEESLRPLDLIVFPELCLTGYVRGRTREFAREFSQVAEHADGETARVMADMAATHNIHIAFGFPRKHARIPFTVYNSASLVGPDGVVGTQDKIHLPAEEQHWFAHGESIDVFDTPIGNVGMAICYDAVFPEPSRILALKGAEIIIVLFAGPRHARSFPTRLCTLASVRASENRTYVVACKIVGQEGELEYYGGSAVAAPTGELLSCASDDDDEKILYATLSGELLAEERAYAPVFRDRRPEMYGTLTKTLKELQ